MRKGHIHTYHHRVAKVPHKAILCVDYRAICRKRSHVDSFRNDTNAIFADSKLFVAVGSYDGGMVGWQQGEGSDISFKKKFALRKHTKAVKALALSLPESKPRILISGGSDDALW